MVKAQLNGETFQFQARESRGHLLVPARIVFGKLGASMDTAAGRLTVALGSTSVEMQLGQKKVMVHSGGSTRSETWALAPQDYGATFVPLRPLAETLGFTVECKGRTINLIRVAERGDQGEEAGEAPTLLTGPSRPPLKGRALVESPTQEGGPLDVWSASSEFGGGVEAEETGSRPFHKARHSSGNPGPDAPEVERVPLDVWSASSAF